MTSANRLVLLLTGTTLTQQVPRLVELDLEVRESRAVGVAEALARVRGTKGLLLGHELVDVVEHRAVAGREAGRVISHGVILPREATIRAAQVVCWV